MFKKKTREGERGAQGYFANCHSIHSPERFQKPTHAEIEEEKGGGRERGEGAGRKGSHPAKQHYATEGNSHTRTAPLHPDPGKNKNTNTFYKRTGKIIIIYFCGSAGTCTQAHNYTRKRGVGGGKEDAPGMKKKRGRPRCSFTHLHTQLHTHTHKTLLFPKGGERKKERLAISPSYPIVPRPESPKAVLKRHTTTTGRPPPRLPFPQDSRLGNLVVTKPRSVK